MRRTLLALIALAVAAALALFSWRWLAPHGTPATTGGAPARQEQRVEALTPPPAPPEIRAERGEEPPPPSFHDRVAAMAAARAGAHEVARLPVELSVVDLATRAPLREVELTVVPYRPGRDAAPIDFRPDLPAAVRGDSPLVIPIAALDGAITNFLVNAPGHAATTVAIDARAGGAREVRLEAACELDLMADAPAGDEELTFELRRVDDLQKTLTRSADRNDEFARSVDRKPSSWATARRTAAEVIERMRGDLERNQELLGRLASFGPAAWRRAATREEWTRFDRLAPGDWIATVVAEERRDAPLAAVALHLGAGAVERRTLVPKERAPVRAVAVHGTIELAPEWSRDDATHAPTKLVLDRAIHLIGLPAQASHREIDQFEAVGSSRFTWSAGELATGSWFARLPQFAVVIEFSVRDGEQNDVALVVGAPCDVDLDLVDARTNQSADLGQVTISSGEGDAGRDARRVERDSADHHFHFRAVPGRLHVRVDLFDASLFIPERAFDLVAGPNRLVFELKPFGRIRPRLTDGAAGVPWSDDFHLEVMPLNGSGGLAGLVNDLNGTQLVVAPAGRYSLRVDDVPGFEPAGPIEVDVAAGATVDVAIPLTRAR